MAKSQHVNCERKKAGGKTFNQGEMDRLLTAIIAKTAFANTSFKIEVADMNESPHPGKKFGIRVLMYNGDSRIRIKIRLPGTCEWWNLNLWLTREILSNVFKFHDEVRQAAEDFCEAENAAIKVEKPAVALPSKPGDQIDQEDDSETGREEAGVSASAPIEFKRKTRTMATKIITDEMEAKILVDWMNYTAGGKNISQREFMQRFYPSTLKGKILPVSLVGYLEKKGIIKVTVPVPRKPMLEMLEAGFQIIENYKRQQEAEELRQREEVLIDEALEFPGKTLPLLRRVAKLQEAQLECQVAIDSREEVATEISRLEKELEAARKLLVQKAAAVLKAEEDFRNLFSKIDPKKLGELIELAESAKKQKG